MVRGHQLNTTRSCGYRI